MVEPGTESAIPCTAAPLHRPPQSQSRCRLLCSHQTLIMDAQLNPIYALTLSTLTLSTLTLDCHSGSVGGALEAPHSVAFLAPSQLRSAKICAAVGCPPLILPAPFGARSPACRIHDCPRLLGEHSARGKHKIVYNSLPGTFGPLKQQPKLETPAFRIHHSRAHCQKVLIVTLGEHFARDKYKIVFDAKRGTNRK